MVASALLPALRQAIRQNEIGNASPYCLSYACKGASGASFGIFQGDTSANQTARATLLQALQAAGVDDETSGRILAAVSQPCPDGDPLTPDDAAVADAALASAEGQAIVDAMDATLLEVVLGGLDACLAAAATRQLDIDPAAQLYIALWVNMTGAPKTLSSWLAGTRQLGLAPPGGPIVATADLERYLQASTYFQQNPRNFRHLQDSVKAGIALLPQA